MRPADTLHFHWQSEGPNLVIGGLVVTILLAVAVFLSRGPNRSWVVAVVFSLWAVFVGAMFVGKKVWRDEVWIEATEMHGRCGFSKFQLRAADVADVQYHRGRGHALFVFLTPGKKSVQIPMVWDDRKAAYQKALAEFSHVPSQRIAW